MPAPDWPCADMPELLLDCDELADEPGCELADELGADDEDESDGPETVPVTRIVWFTCGDRFTPLVGTMRYSVADGALLLDDAVLPLCPTLELPLWPLWPALELLLCPAPYADPLLLCAPLPLICAACAFVSLNACWVADDDMPLERSCSRQPMTVTTRAVDDEDD